MMIAAGALGFAGACSSSSGDSGTVGTAVFGQDSGPLDAGLEGSPPPIPKGAGLPCAVVSVLENKCDGCHSDPPVGGALTGLVSVADLLATSKEDPTKNEAEVALSRMQSPSSPMPPASSGVTVSQADIAAFQAWVSGGFLGACGDAAAVQPSVDPFAGAPAYASQMGGTAHDPGQNCMDGCHAHGFSYAGTLTDGNGVGIAGAEIRLVDATNKAVSIYTGSNGNFYTSEALTGLAHVGARNGAGEVIMVQAVNVANGGCNGCHVTGGVVAPLHLP